MERRYDFLVIGSGIAGLFYALEVSRLNPTARIAVITKKNEEDTSTNRAQGGIAAVLSGTDSFDRHIADSLSVGCGLGHQDVVRQIIKAGPSVIGELVAFGVRFSRDGDHFDLGREGGHTENRVLHSEDFTGQEIERALLSACRERSDRIDLIRNHLALDLAVGRDGRESYCAGAFVFSEGDRQFDVFLAPVTMLSTGGLAQVYFHHTNPLIATGDGVAMAWRAGVSVANLEFIQFHPTCLYGPARYPFLISEAVRGEGGRLKSVDGRYLMDTVHELKDLAPRDLVARVIDKELKQSGEEFVLLDCTHLDGQFLKRRFPNIYSACLNRGFDMTTRPIPVVPAAHYACGGVVAEVDGRTELPGLFVAGEVACSGMHGANRLASNSLLEAVVMAKLAAAATVKYHAQVPPGGSIPIDNQFYSSLSYPRERILIAHDRRQLSRVMSDFVGIVRSVDRLVLAMEKIKSIKSAIEEYYLSTPATYAVVELRNLATVAELIVRCAIERQESRGLHYVEDYPQLDDAFSHDTVLKGSLTND